MKTRPWRCFFSAHYDQFMEPLERATLRDRRSRLLESASGRVLEIGAGTGANFPYYPGFQQLVAGEPDESMRRVFRTKFSGNLQGRASLIGFVGEALPFADASFDLVVTTLVLCSVFDPERVCLEISRVLRPGGRLFFLEHVRSSGRHGRMQDLVQPIWSLAGCGCRPNRRTIELLETTGYRIEEVEYFDPFHGLSWVARWFGRIVVPFAAGFAASPDRRI